MRRPQYSPSRLQVYQSCARQYQFQYVLKVPRRGWAHQSFGLSLHRTLQVVHEAGGPQARDLERAQRDLEASWHGAGYESKEQELAELARGKELLAAYYETWSGAEGEPILLEKRLSAPYRGVMLLGIVDRVDRHPDGQLEIIDYKSGAAPASVPAATLQQLAIYHYLVGEKLGQDPAAHSVHYLASNVRLSVTLDAPLRESILEEARRTAGRIEADEQFAPTLGRGCAWCDYLGRCPEGRRHLREAGERP